MAFEALFNFRSSAGPPPTDGANSTYVLCGGGSGEEYPTTRAGFTFGWNSGAYTADGRDRNTGGDARLAGWNGYNAGHLDVVTLRVDLPSPGTYRVWLAMGDDAYGSITEDWRILDNGVALDTKTGLSTGAGVHQFLDATGVNRTSQADWIANNASIDLVFGSTIFQLEVGATGHTGRAAHLRILQLAAATPLDLMGQTWL